jgi:hypothetical protein
MSGKRQKIQYKQLLLAFGSEGRGESPDAEHKRTEPLVAKPAVESLATEERLMEEVCDRKNLEIAWKRVRGNKDSPGVDGMTIDQAVEYLREHWPTIRSELLEGTYQPQPVRRVGGGGVNRLLIGGWDERRAYLGSDTLFSHRRLGRLHFLPRHRSSNVEPHVRILAETCPGQAGYHSCDRLLRRCSVLRSDRENYGQQAPRLRHILTTVNHATPASTAAGLMRQAFPAL